MTSSLASLILLLLLPRSAAGAVRLNLPQSKETVVLAEGPRRALKVALAGSARRGPFALGSESAAQLLEGLPTTFRGSCSEVVGQWGESARGTARWTVRVLFSQRDSEGMKALLALRCGSSGAGAEAYYDERPALVSFAGESAALSFIPLAEDCANCSTFYHVEFSQALAAVGASLVELRVNYSNENNPCCCGVMEKSGDRLVILALPGGQQVLVMDQMSYESGVDDSVVCQAKIDYSRDGAGRVENINSEARCARSTENKQPILDVERRSFRWNAGARRFDELKGPN